jgi:LytS/YehU family sensor histidine kinase
LRHGLEPKPGPGHVLVRAARDAARLTIEIIDDGLGLGTSPRRDGIGLGNTRERLVRLYENDWSLDVEPGAGRGTIVRVRLPFEVDERLTAERDDE